MYILKMNDLFDAEIMCKDCKIETIKNELINEGFKLRYSECPKCEDKWYHPTDLRDYEKFKKLKAREFHVKLRMVGNSFSVTIPKEIIEFEEQFNQMEKEMDKIMKLCLDQPGRLSLHFNEDLNK